MKTVRIAVLGHFGTGKHLLNGQTVKTTIITDELCRQLGKSEVRKIDTHGGIKNLIRAPWQVISALRSARNVVMMPAHNGLRVYGPLLAAAVRFFPNRKLHYVVIGGWLSDFLEKRSWLTRSLKRFSGIYVETRTLKQSLEDKGFTNVELLPNCKKLSIQRPEELPNHQEPYKFCTFSRIMREKGIEDAVTAIREINESAGKTVCILDLYGQVAPDQTEWFSNLKAGFPEYIRYRGAVPFDQSVDTLKEYYALLFPTHFFTEGIPGTVIDGYAAGVPVIAAKWQSFRDVIDEGETGFGYPFGDYERFRQIIAELLVNPDKVFALRRNCLQKAYDYLPESVVEVLVMKTESN